MKKKLLAMVMTLAMVLSLVPVTALAEGGQEEQTTVTTEDETGGETGGTTGGETGGTTGGETGGTTGGETGGTTGGETGGTTGGETGGTTGGETGGTNNSTEEKDPPAKPEGVAKIGDTYYQSMKDAFSAAKPGDTIELQEDITFREKKDSLEVKVSKNFDGELTIDLNDHYIDGNNVDKCIWRTGTTDCWPSKLTVKNGTLKNGDAESSSGGAIQWQGDLAIENCKFENNDNCAIVVLKGKVDILKSSFTGNKTRETRRLSGAAIQITENQGTTIRDSVFSDNTVNEGYSMGGAVYVDHGTLSIAGCTFDSNSAGFGGAIAVADVKNLTIAKNTNCLGNIATSCGGGIYAIRSTATFESGSALYGNSSAYGGAIYVDTSNINIAANSAVYNNTAETAGDDLFFFNGTTFTLPNAKDMSGDRILSSDKAEIIGWYHDGWYKWNATAKDGQGGYEQIGRWTAETADEYTPLEKDSHAISLKAAHPLMYTLTYNVTGDAPEGYTAPAKQTLVNGSSYTVAAVPASVSGSKDGVNGTYSFSGWKTVDGTTLTGEQELTGDVTLYGVWTFTKKSSHRPGGGGGGTVDIPDEDVPTGLDLKNHYGYIIGYPVDYYTGEPTTDQTKKPVRPEGKITRAEVATIYFRMLTEENRAANWNQVSGFSDVKSKSWYNNAISTLTKAGILEGYEDGTFRPNGYITRAEFATIAIRFFSGVYEGEDLFPDIKDHWARDYINNAADKGLVKGYEDGTFGPDRYITRAEAVTLVNRTLNRHPDKDCLHEDMLVWPDNMDTSKWYYADMQEATNSHEPDKDKSNSEKEYWSKTLPIRDWEALEKEWSNANSAPGEGEVV